MPVHSFHIFDRKGKTLFTKRYILQDNHNKDVEPASDPAELSENRKLVFGMLYSLREITTVLSPQHSHDGLHYVRTGASTLYTFETNSGLRLALYVTGDKDPTPTTSTTTTAAAGGGGGNSNNNNNNATNIRSALSYIYNDIWIQAVTRSPLYRPTDPNVPNTNFEAAVDEYLAQQSWFR